MHKSLLPTALALLACLTGACDRSKSKSGKEVVVYTSVDQPIAKPILDEFTARTGIKVLLKTDAEASKTAGLVEAIRAERGNPQCDVFWNNEVFHTIALANEGLLDSYESPAAKDIPAQFKGERWASNGLRVRMLAVSPAADKVSTLEGLIDPAYKGRVAIANPAFGTTSGHVASFFVLWSKAEAEAFLRDLKANDVKLLGGNAEVVKQIAAGNIDVGLTDNDDVDAALREGGKIKGVPAGTHADPGTLAIPCTVGLVTGAKRSAEAKQLIDYLLSSEVEGKLVAAKFAKTGVRSPSTEVPLVKIDYAEVARQMPGAVATARRILEGRE